MHSTGLPSLTVSALTAGGKPPAVLIVSVSVADWGARASPALGLPWCGLPLDSYGRFRPGTWPFCGLCPLSVRGLCSVSLCVTRRVVNLVYWYACNVCIRVCHE